MRRLILAVPLCLAAAGLAGAPAGATGLKITVAGEANGEIEIDLLEDVAPAHAERIATLAEQGFYDGVVFHRVIDGFMAQTGDGEFGLLEGGDMRRAGGGGSDLPDLKAEFSDLPFERGMVGMARTPDPNSANSQFFIMLDAAPHLNGQYTIVGKVTSGMDVVNDIKLGLGPNGTVLGQPDVMTEVVVTE